MTSRFGTTFRVKNSPKLFRKMGNGFLYTRVQMHLLNQYPYPKPLKSVNYEEDACRMEHTLSPETIDRFIALEEFRESGPPSGDLKGESFRRFLRKRKLIPAGKKPGPG